MSVPLRVLEGGRRRRHAGELLWPALAVWVLIVWVLAIVGAVVVVRGILV